MFGITDEQAYMIEALLTSSLFQNDPITANIYAAGIQNEQMSVAQEALASVATSNLAPNAPNIAAIQNRITALCQEHNLTPTGSSPETGWFTFSGTAADAQILSLESDIKEVSTNFYGEECDFSDSTPYFRGADPSFWNLDLLNYRPELYPYHADSDIYRGSADRQFPRRDNSFWLHNTGYQTEIWMPDTGIFGGITTNPDFMTAPGSLVSRVKSKETNGLPKVLGGVAGGGSHGTAMASLAAGLTCGVSKGADIYPIHIVSNNTYTINNLVIALQYARQNLVKPAVVSISLASSSTNSLVTQEINALLTMGVPVVIAAGNGYKNALAVPAAIVVGMASIGTTISAMTMPPATAPAPGPYLTGAPLYAIGLVDSDVDIFAPSANVNVPSNLSPSDKQVFLRDRGGMLVQYGYQVAGPAPLYYGYMGDAGTSGATATTAGVIGMYLRAYAAPTAPFTNLPAQVEAWIQNQSTKLKLRNPSNQSTTLQNGAQNRFLHLPPYAFGPIT